MRIAIYGGTFNPIHLGHTALAQSLIDQRLVDEVWLMVARLNPLKAATPRPSKGQGSESESISAQESASNDPSEIPGLASKTFTSDFQSRLRWARLATADMPRVQVSDFESTLPSPSYTVNTLNALASKFPQHTFSLVIGADNWLDFHRWRNHDEILRRWPVLIYRRPGYDIDLASLPDGADVQIVTTPLYDVSSTEIRRGRKLEMLHPAVKSDIFG